MSYVNLCDFINVEHADTPNQVDIYLVKSNKYEIKQSHMNGVSYSKKVWKSDHWYCAPGELKNNQADEGVVVCNAGNNGMYFDHMNVNEGCITGDDGGHDYCATIKSWTGNFCLSTYRADDFGGKCDEVHECIYFQMKGDNPKQVS